MIRSQKLFILKVFSIALFGLSVSSAEIIKHEISRATLKEFAYSDVCKFFNKTELPIVTPIDLVQLDCMGDSVNVGEFCNLTFKDSDDYLRGFINSDTKKVICQFGDRVSMGLECVNSYSTFCKDAKTGCETLQASYAKKLLLINYSIFSESSKKILNCHFMKN